jgi:hypothetical protein
MLKGLWQDERGQDLIEYALIAAFVTTAAPAIWGTGYISRARDVIVKVGAVLVQSVS